MIYDERTMNKVLTVQKYIDNVLTIHEAMDILQCSERTVYRYIAAYKKHGPPWLIHWLKGKPSNNRSRCFQWVEKYATQKCYEGFGPTLLAEKLSEYMWYKISRSSMRRRMIEWGLWTAKPRKVTKCLRARKEWYGMMIQFDGSYHDRLENGEEKCLLLAIDDATSCPIYAEFSESESLSSIIAYRYNYFHLHGKPSSIYVDRHASYKVNHGSDCFNNEMLTRFARAMKYLGISVIYAWSAQAKGRVERAFRTFQDRWIKEMRLAWITSYDEAQRYCNDILLPQRREKFAKPAAVPWNFHIPMGEDDWTNIDRYFAQRSKRKIQRWGVVSYLGRKYVVDNGQNLDGTRNVTVLETHLWDIQIRNSTTNLCFQEYKM